MRELEKILQELKSSESEQQGAALATLVETEGSAYRRPGARMLVFSDGRRTGSLSGGCLEADVAERARKVMETGLPELAVYDNRDGKNDLMEMGCRGRMCILVEPARTPQVTKTLDALARCLQARQTGALATVFRCEGTSAAPGQRMLFTPNGPTGNISEPVLRQALEKEAATVQQSGRILIKEYLLESGSTRVLLEPILPPLALLVCGAGEDALPVAAFAALLGWQAVVTDHRPAWLTPERFPSAHRLLLLRPEKLQEAFQPDGRTAAVIMTHHYAHDLALLRFLLSTPAPYIGLLGPRKRTQELLQELEREGKEFPEEELARLHGPAGLDTGSETPEEIALSITAEILTVINGRQGGPLCALNAPIHGPVCIEPQS